MPHALIHGETVRELAPGRPFVDADGVQHPAEALTLWSAEELASIGVYEFDEALAPNGQVVVSRGVAIEAGLPVRTLVTQDAPPAPIPIAIDMRQASLMLDAAPHGEGTRLDAVDAYLATQSRRVQIEWARAKELRRDHPMVAIMAVFFNQTQADVDQFFRDGAAIGPTLTL